MRSSVKRSSPFAAVILALALTAPANAAAGDRDYPVNYTPALPKLAGVRVPVVLPWAVLGDAAAPFKSYVFVADVQREHYLVDIWTLPDCGDATVCRFAHVEAGRPGRRPLTGERVRLKRLGVTAYFTLGSCGFGCADSTIAFDRHGWRYCLGIKGAGKDYLIYEAGLLRAFAAPAGRLHAAHTPAGAEKRALLVKRYRRILEDRP